jgi:hypothetical protein
VKVIRELSHPARVLTGRGAAGLRAAEQGGRCTTWICVAVVLTLWALVGGCSEEQRILQEERSQGPKEIVFASDREGSHYELYAMDADGSNQTRLASNPAWNTLRGISFDGEKIAFVSDRDGNAEIYVMDADGSDQMRLTMTSRSDTAPDFLPKEAR